MIPPNGRRRRDTRRPDVPDRSRPEVPTLAEVPAPPRPPRPASRDALAVAAHFIVEIDGRPLSCARVTGLELASRVEALTSRRDPDHPDDPERVRWSAPAQPGALRLTRALDGDRTLYEWRKEAMGEKPAVRSVQIRHLDRAGGDVLHTWRLESAWPLRWAGPQYDALHGGVALEELDIVFNVLTWQGG